MPIGVWSRLLEVARTRRCKHLALQVDASRTQDALPRLEAARAVPPSPIHPLDPGSQFGQCSECSAPQTEANLALLTAAAHSPGRPCPPTQAAACQLLCTAAFSVGRLSWRVEFPPSRVTWRRGVTRRRSLAAEVPSFNTGFHGIQVGKWQGSIRSVVYRGAFLWECYVNTAEGCWRKLCVWSNAVVVRYALVGSSVFWCWLGGELVC